MQDWPLYHTREPERRHHSDSAAILRVQRSSGDPMHTTAVRRRAFPLALLVLATAIAACQGSSIPSTGADIDTRQAVLALNENIVDVREENAMLQAQIDSIRGVVAYQDSVLRQLALMAGVSMRPQSAPMQ
jgi:hypothetical protein